MKFFDRTFLDTSRIFVKYALPKGDNRIDRPWSRYSEGSSRFEQARKDKDEEKNKKRPSSEITKTSDDPKVAEMSDAKKRKLDEFLGVTTKKGKLWANDDGFGFDIAQSDKKKGKAADKKDAKKDAKKDVKKTGDGKKDAKEEDVKRILKAQESDDDSDDDDYQDLSSLKQKHSDNVNGDDDEASDMSEDEEEIAETAQMDVDEKPAPAAEETEEKDDKKAKKGKKEKKVPERKQYPELDQKIVADTGRLFVRNLPFNASEDDVRTLFSRFGNVSEVHLSIDKISKRSKGFGFVTFHFPAHAIEAAKQLDGQFFQGRILHVLPAKQQEELAEDDTTNTENASTSTKPARGPGPQNGTANGFVSEFQKKKQAKQKEMANQDYNWNTLFIRPDAVAGAMASNLQVSKSELLDVESSSSMAVRLALGETNIIKETKEFLASEGVHLEALKGHYNKSIVRSTTIIIAKNIPINTQIEELRNVFGRFGTLVKVVMPPSRTVSLIEFAAPQEARAAFKHLAYKQFKDAPLFLEWAPTGLFGEKKKTEDADTEAESGKTSLKEVKETITKTTTDTSTRSDTPAEVKATETKVSSSEPATETPSKKDKKEKKDKQAVADESAASTAAMSKMGSLDSVLEEASLTLFVKNLSFATTEESLKTLVDRMLGEVNNVSIAMHNVKGEMMSQGYGFIECKTREQAVKAWKQLQGSMLDGHQLQVSFSAQRKAGASVSLAELQKMASKRKDGPSGQITASTKIMVKNVPFEATRNEIRDLFAPFGELKSVRLPNKAGGKGHRGFAFVEYVTPDEAAAAIDALGTTHLYNRRLVIDYAEQDGDVEQIRAKTAAQFEQ